MARPAAPARSPIGAWPMELRADMVAAFLDYPDTAALLRAIERNEAPRPTGLRGTGRSREPVWCRVACETFIAHRHHVAVDVAGEPIEGLV
jgi:hypothetical protein